MWTVIYAKEFDDWLSALPEDVQDSVESMIRLLKMEGPQLSRPYADVIHGSPLSNLKELRIQHRGQPYRAFFVFDPQRQAIVLCAGNKQGDKRFYKRMTPLAESIYQRYLQEKKQ